jgi:hypothetical protein
VLLIWFLSGKSAMTVRMVMTRGSTKVEYEQIMAFTWQPVLRMVNRML